MTYVNSMQRKQLIIRIKKLKRPVIMCPSICHVFADHLKKVFQPHENTTSDHILDDIDWTGKTNYEPIKYKWKDVRDVIKIKLTSINLQDMA